MSYYIKSNRVHKPSNLTLESKNNKTEDFNCCMICVRNCSAE